MSQYSKMFENIKNSNNFEENARLLQYLGNKLKYDKTPIAKAEIDYIKNFAIGEMKRLIDAIPTAENYREKDNMFFYENSLLMVLTYAGKDTSSMTADDAETIKKLVTLVSSERILENTVDEVFKQTTIEEADINKLLKVVTPIKDEYQRGMLYQGLNEYKEKLKTLNSSASSTLADFVAEDLARLLKDLDIKDEGKLDTLEIASDVCKYFINEKLLALLEQIMTLKVNRVRYYALETLLINKIQIDANVIKELAEDLCYANLTYHLLEKHGKLSLYPVELATPEYLAKSDMVHWLIYPTELNKVPDEIELLGAIKVKKELYHVFKFKSDSETLGDDLKNEYLIGWSEENGGTFSNFDKLSDYEKKTPQKTLKYIAKKLLR